MWDILFPGEARPRSAFSGNYIEEVVTVIRHCWIDKSTTIIENAIQNHGNVKVDKGLLQRLMDTVFDRLEEEVCSAPPIDEMGLKWNEVGQGNRQHASKRSNTE